MATGAAVGAEKAKLSGMGPQSRPSRSSHSFKFPGSSPGFQNNYPLLHRNHVPPPVRLWPSTGSGCEGKVCSVLRCRSVGKTLRCCGRLRLPSRTPDRPPKRELCFCAALFPRQRAASRASFSPRRLMGLILIVRVPWGALWSCDLAC